MNVIGDFITIYLLESFRRMNSENYVVVTDLKHVLYFIEPKGEEFVTLLGDRQLKVDKQFIEYLAEKEKTDSPLGVFSTPSMDDVLDAFNYVKSLPAIV